MDSGSGGWKSIDVKYPVNIRASVESGQPLHFHSVHTEHEDHRRLSYVTPKGLMQVKYEKDGLCSRIHYRHFGKYTDSAAREELVRRFGIDEDMAEIYTRINTDPIMKNAILRHLGMRVTQNDPWETTLCFVISQFNNIKRIKGIVRNIVNRFGEDLEHGETSTKLFPTADMISRFSINDLRACGAGFRAKYILSVAEECANNVDLRKAYRMGYPEAKEYLMQLDGVGDKVADCILLMGFKKLAAFPIDVWMQRAMERAYFSGRKTSARKVHEFAEEKWGEYAGYAQQYLFQNARLNTLLV